MAVSRRDLGPIVSVSKFTSELFALRRSRSFQNCKFWYRGIGDAQNRLVPSIGRDYRYVRRWTSFGFVEEWQLLHRFRRRSYLEVGRLLTAGESIFIARHHGLPTRLLDWTANALYGLYFACQPDGRTGTTGVLWALVARRGREPIDALELAGISDERRLLAYLDGEEMEAYHLRRHRWVDEPPRPRVKLVEPPFNSPRLRAQDGVFTVHSAPHVALDEFLGLDFAAKDLDVAQLFRWEIPKRSKATLVEELSGLGITRRSVYPDLDGIALSLKETDALWSRRRPRRKYR